MLDGAVGREIVAAGCCRVRVRNIVAGREALAFFAFRDFFFASRGVDVFRRFCCPDLRDAEVAADAAKRDGECSGEACGAEYLSSGCIGGIWSGLLCC